MFRTLVTLLLNVLISAHVSAGESPVGSSSNELHILTYNVKFLPHILLRHADKPLKRAKYIPGQLLSDTLDIIVLQEAFDKKAVRMISRKLMKKFPYVIGPANNSSSIKLNSGVIMFSRFPIKKLGEVRFNTCDGADCWARKGGLLGEVDYNGKKLQILGTHAEAGGSFEMKVSQFKQLKGLMDEFYDEDIPQIACGDFNASSKNKPLYDTLSTILDVENGPLEGDLQYTSDHMLNDLHDHNPQNRNEIDYIFLRSKKIRPLFSQRKVVRYQHPWSKKHSDLSDHFAVKMKILF